MRLVCSRWYNAWKSRNRWKFWNSIRLTQTVHERGVARVPVLPNRKWHGRLYSYIGNQEEPYYYCDYVLGKKEGESVYYFTRTNHIQIRANWHEGKLHGDWREYAITGKLLNWKQYWNGKLHGHERAYCPVTGALRSDVQYFDGKKHGVAKTWRWDNGEERTTRYFVMGTEMQDVETYLRMMGAVKRT